MSPLLLLFVFTANFVSVTTVDWVQVWSDEFNGRLNSAPDGNKWKHEQGNNNGWGNNELQYYTSDRSNSYLDGKGRLVISARKEQQKFTSARIITAGKFTQKYGRVEASIKVPTGKGIWPAFWMLGQNIGSVGWPECGEIDIMEVRGSQPGTVVGTIHGPGYFGAGGLSASYQLPNGKSLGDGFHTYSVEWSNYQIIWKLDGRVYHTETKDKGRLQGKKWVFDQPFFIILNCAVGGNFDGNPDNSLQFPRNMLIDYVRVFRKP